MVFDLLIYIQNKLVKNSQALLMLMIHHYLVIWEFVMLVQNTYPVCGPHKPLGSPLLTWFNFDPSMDE